MLVGIERRGGRVETPGVELINALILFIYKTVQVIALKDFK